MGRLPQDVLDLLFARVGGAGMRETEGGGGVRGGGPVGLPTRSSLGGARPREALGASRRGLGVQAQEEPSVPERSVFHLGETLPSGPRLPPVI